MKSSQKQLAGLSLILVVFAANGCSKKAAGTTGVWVQSGLPSGIEVTLELNPDETWVQSMKDSSHKVSASGTYKSNKFSLTMTELRTSIDGKDKTTGKNYQYSYKVKWVSDDEIELTQPNMQPATYKRKK